MPVTTMGIGRLGNEDTVFKRKFRWIFDISDFGLGSGSKIVTYSTSGQQGHICKVSSRPEITFNEQEVKHVIEDVFLPAKAQWSPISIEVYDLKGESFLYQWMTSFYNPETGLVNPIANGSNISTGGVAFPKKFGTLSLLDGHGEQIELWEMYGCWPSNIVWGQLDHSSSDVMTINFTLRYDRAVKII